MGAAWLCVRSEMRRRWRFVAVFALVVGIAGSIVLTATAGARRTASSFDRFSEATRAYDVLVFYTKLQPSAVAKLRRLPGVETIGEVRTLAITFGDGTFIPAGGPEDDVVLHDIARPRIIEGRSTDPDVAEEIVVGEPLARQRGLKPGDTFQLRSYTREQIDALTAEVGAPIPDPEGPAVRMRVVGISRLPIDLSQQGESGGILITSRAFVEKYGAQIGDYLDAVILARLDDGVDGVPRFVRQLRASVGDDAVIDEVEPTAVSTSGVRESIDVLAIGLGVLAVIALVATVTALGFAAARVVALGAAERATWHALGLTRAQRAFASAGPTVLAAGVGGVIAIVGALCGSALMPIGLAREAEPSPGLQFDALVLTGGALALVTAVSGIAVLLAWRRADASVTPVRPRPSKISQALEASGAPPSLRIGGRAALEAPRGRAALPVRSTLVAAAAAVTGVVAVSIFSASLDRLADVPSLHGYGWEMGIQDSRAEHRVTNRRCSGLEDTRVARDPAVRALASVCILNIEIEGHPVGAFGYNQFRGTIVPTVIEGRAPRARDELALGTTTLDTIGASIGDRVRGEGPGGSEAYTIVGRVAVPSLGNSTQALADGAIFTGAGLDRLDDPAAELSDDWVVVRFRPDADRRAAERRFARLPGVGDPEESGVAPVAVPLEVRRLQQVNDVPFALAGVLALLGMTAVGYALVASIRSRRNELAVLKMLGFRRRQVAAVVGWQATTVACVGILVGIPLGIGLGRLIWWVVADDTGVAVSSSVPVAVLAAVMVATLVLANLVAGAPARAAARSASATALRTE